MDKLQRARMILAAQYNSIKLYALAAAVLLGKYDDKPEIKAVLAALNESATTQGLLASTPAAPGIDLEQFREAVLAQHSALMDSWCGDPETKEAADKQRDQLLALIDASLKSGSDAQSWKLLESGEIIARGDQLLESDCTTWGELVGWEVGLPYNPAFHVPMRRSQTTSAEVGS